MLKTLKEAILLFMSHICHRHMKIKLDQEHKEQMKEITDYIQERIDAGIAIYLIANEEFIDNAFTLKSDPLPKHPLIKHLSVVDIDEE
jgi:hypothetical protein